MSEETLDATEKTQGTGERPTFLTVLCILTWIGSGLGIIGNFTGNSAVLPSWYIILIVLINIATAYGAYEMWNLKKRGLHIYTVGEVLAIILPFVLIYGILPAYAANMLGSFMVIGALFPIAFLIMYWANAKHLS